MEPVVITLMSSDPAALPPEAAVRGALSDAGAETVANAWLSGNTALDVFAQDITPEDARTALVPLIAGKPADIIVHLREERRKRLLICDMDSTMIEQECVDELAAYVGKKAEVAAITERAMNGELDFNAALTERVALLEGLPEPVLEEVFRDCITFMPGGRELVETMRTHGAYTVLVSGGFTFFTQRVGEALGFHETRGNRLEIRNGALTGRVIPPILGKDAKLEALRDISAARGIAPSESLAIGDGANDLPMLQAAGLGIAYRAKPHVRKMVRAQLNIVDLRGALWAQGYPTSSSPLKK